MLTIGLIREGKIPVDNRVCLSPLQCKWLQENKNLKIIVQPSEIRCFSNREYLHKGIAVREDLGECNLILGIKEVPVNQLISGKQYLFFSHTIKKQPHNQRLLQEIVQKNITLIDWECLEHEDGQRILGFGFFAGVVGAHNGMMAYGKRSGKYDLCRVNECRSYKHLIQTYFGLKLPNVKVAVTGSGRVASGILEILNLLDVIEAEPEEYLKREFSYPVFVHLYGSNLYERIDNKPYSRIHFHQFPQKYKSKFLPYAFKTDILMNGTYWEKGIPPLFNWEDIVNPNFRIKTIADISNDFQGGVPCNIGNSWIEDPVYGVDPHTRERTTPYQSHAIDVMAISNLPNELPREASAFFGDQLIKYIIDELIIEHSPILERATIVKNGQLTPRFQYLADYASS